MEASSLNPRKPAPLRCFGYSEYGEDFGEAVKDMGALGKTGIADCLVLNLQDNGNSLTGI